MRFVIYGLFYNFNEIHLSTLLFKTYYIIFLFKIQNLIMSCNNCFQIKFQSSIIQILDLMSQHNSFRMKSIVSFKTGVTASRRWKNSGCCQLFSATHFGRRITFILLGPGGTLHFSSDQAFRFDIQNEHIHQTLTSYMCLEMKSLSVCAWITVTLDKMNRN